MEKSSPSIERKEEKSSPTLNLRKRKGKKGFCFGCRKRRRILAQQIIVTKNNRTRVAGECPKCHTAMSHFIPRLIALKLQEQEKLNAFIKEAEEEKK